MVWPDAASFSSSSVGDALPCVLYERRCGGSCIGGSTVSSARSLCHRVRRYPRGLDDDCGRGWRRRPATVARRRSPSLLPSSILKQNLYSIRAEMMRKESPWLGLRIVYLSLGNGRRIKANQASFFFLSFLILAFSVITQHRENLLQYKSFCSRLDVNGSHFWLRLGLL